MVEVLPYKTTPVHVQILHHLNIIVRTIHLWEIHTISHEVVRVESVTGPTLAQVGDPHKRSTQALTPLSPTKKAISHGIIDCSAFTHYILHNRMVEKHKNTCCRCRYPDQRQTEAARSACSECNTDHRSGHQILPDPSRR